VKTVFLQHVLRQRFENQLTCWEVNSSKGTTWRWRRAPKRVGVLVKQRDLLYERLCISCWFNEDEIKLSKCVTRRTRWSYSGRFVSEVMWIPWRRNCAILQFQDPACVVTFSYTRHWHLSGLTRWLVVYGISRVSLRAWTPDILL